VWRREADAARGLAHQGHLIRLWALVPKPTGPTGPTASRLSPTLGLWRAVSEAQLQTALASLPLRKYVTTQTTKLTPHPSDANPGVRGQASLPERCQAGSP
jgi:muconolactone delta-isomerase